MALGVGCDRASDSPARPVMVSAAASTRDAVALVAQAFEERTGQSIEINSGSSSALAAQILRGAPADLFLSANRRWADAVDEAGLAERSVWLLSNDLVLVAPEGNPAEIQAPADLLSSRVETIAIAGENAPAGVYAEQALRSLDLWDRLEASGKIVRGSDVRATLGLVERGEAQAGVVYATDAPAAQGVLKVCGFSAESHDPIEYVLVLLRASASNAAATQFFEALQSDQGAEVFRGEGFLSGAVAEPIANSTDPK
jgi:molybdate transport system substrate-binding protein